MIKNAATISRFVAEQINQPLNVFGLQKDSKTQLLTFLTCQPQADQVKVIQKGTNKVVATLDKIDEQGLFYKKLRRKNTFEYFLEVTEGEHTYQLEDSYAYEPTLGELDIHLLSEGTHHYPYKILGAHTHQQNGTLGVAFSVWAPNASRVSVIGNFNNWDGRRHPMQNVSYSGYWNIFIPNVIAGDLYKFELADSQGHLLPQKSDPMGSHAQYRPDTASIVSENKSYQWQDEKWLAEREKRNDRDAAISIYEVHLGSWKRDADNNFLNYRELADQLIPYTLEMGFTHLQLMPVSEFPYDGSWGYQPVGLFAATARFGTAEDFQYFVDECHKANLGVLIDWVPGHFPTDTHGLAEFDGTCLYEHADPRQGFHPDWNTLIYNYGRNEVANFLRASALHWLDRFHVDGIRVDAVASMLYLDYSREHGEWIPNQHGGRENLEAVDFLKRFNEELYSQYPGCMSVAEESTSWPGVSKPTEYGGLGFGYKWNMGWMNDSLEYMQHDPIHRQYHHNELSFSLVYAFDENFILPISHDEVVHGKGSILDRMPGDAWQKFANLRAYYGFMWAHPGKKLLFMGCEFAQGKEWNFEQSLDWHQLDEECHLGVQQLIKDLNNTYVSTPALYQKDCDSAGFCWLDHDNAQQSVYSFIRFGEQDQKPVLVVCNFTPQVHHNFRIGVPEAGNYQEILNTDADIYGGSNQGNSGLITSQPTPWQHQNTSIEITVPPLSTVMFTLVD
ncbi:MAG: 1,4-alpha-glucan branching protein GlgB [Thalassotalea sp.]